MKVLIKDRRRRASVLFATLVLAMTGVGMGTANAEFARNEVSPEDPARTMEISECIRSNEAGEYWEGEVSTTLRKAEEELARYVTDHPDTTTLLGFCSDRKGLLLTAPEITPDIEAAMAAARLHLSKGETINSAISAAARGSLQDAIDAVMQGDQTGETGMIDASVSRYGKIEVTVSAGSASLAVKELQAAFEAKAPGVVVEVATTDEPPVEFAAATRLNDYSPWNASTRWLASASGGYCSLGLPVTVNGVRMNLTAAHCVGTSGIHTGNNASVGTQYTTTWTGSLNKYGDWKLLSGSSYSNLVFSDAISSSNSLPIGAARWTLMSYGDGMCTSGSTTGQICRYWVDMANASYTASGYSVAYGIKLKHSSTASGPADAGGFRPGDSGGLCYYNPGSGSMVGAGIISAGDGHVGGTNFYCSWVAGLRAWNAGASF